MIGQFSHDFIGCKTRVKSVNSNWSVSIRLLLVKLSRSVCGLFVGFVYVVNKSDCVTSVTNLLVLNSWYKTNLIQP